MDTYYPAVEPGSLAWVELILKGMAGDPLWLERKPCPYDAGTKAEIRALVAILRKKDVPTTQGGAAPPSTASALTDSDLEKDLAALHQQLKSQGPVAADDGGGGVGDMGYFRVAVSLLDKIVSLRERVTNVKAVSDFQNKVVQVFEEVMTPEQRTRAIEIMGIGEGT